MRTLALSTLRGEPAIPYRGTVTTGRPADGGGPW
jgi:hypothetical protein